MMDDATLWMSLPIACVLIDAHDNIAELNPAAEGFFNSSSKALRGAPVWDKLAVDAPIGDALKRARENSSPLFVNDVDVGTGERAPVQCNLQIAPLIGHAGTMVLLISPREMAGRIGQSQGAKSAAKSAIERGWDMTIDEPARQFFYMPLMHSESVVDQDRAVRLMSTRMPEGRENHLRHACAHRSIIRKFGRFPYRNDALGRTTTKAEAKWMADGGYALELQDVDAASTPA